MHMRFGLRAAMVGALFAPSVAAAQVAASTPGACQFTIQGAINDAIALGNTTVYIQASAVPYAENLTIPANITLQAADPMAPLGCDLAAAPGTRPVTIAPGAAGGRVIEITGGDTTVRNIIVQAGTAPIGANGGNILSTSSGVLRLEDSFVTGGKAAMGGGVAIDGCGSLEVAGGSKVLGNRASVAGGGVAVIANGCATPPSVTVLDDGIIGTGSRNQAPLGGDVYLEGADLVVQDTGKIQGGRAVDGGGCVAATGGSTVELSGSAAIGSCSSTASTSRGGAVLLEGSDLVMIDTSRILDSQTQGSGGLVAATAVSTVTASGDASFTDGYATGDGGLVYLDGGSAGTFTSVVMSGGNAQGNGGGGIYATGATTSLVLAEDTHLHSCWAEGDGGGIYLDGALADLLDTTVIGTDLTKPVPGIGHTANGHGGGIFATGAADVVATGLAWSPVLEGLGAATGGVRVEGNTAHSSNGGGIALVGDSTLTGTHVVVTANKSNTGGGVYVEGDVDSASVADLYTSVIHANNAIQGGGVAVMDGGTFYLAANSTNTSCQGFTFLATPDRYCAEISENAATGLVGGPIGEGGGLYVAGLGQAFTDQVAISNNVATDLGTAILVTGTDGVATSLVDLENTLVENIDPNLTQPTVLVATGARLDARYTTFGSDALTVKYDPGTSGRIEHSAIDFPTVIGATGLDIAGAAVTGMCTVGDDANLLGAGARNEPLDPQLVPTARGRYRLDPVNSPALEQCLDTQLIDLDQVARPGCVWNDSGAFENGCGPGGPPGGGD